MHGLKCRINAVLTVAAATSEPVTDHTPRQQVQSDEKQEEGGDGQIVGDVVQELMKEYPGLTEVECRTAVLLAKGERKLQVRASNGRSLYVILSRACFVRSRRRGTRRCALACTST